MTPPDISVVMPTLNEALLVGQAIESAWTAGACQVIVVDGGSTDATVTIAHQLGAQVLVADPGRGNQMAAGVANTDGKIVLFLHADCRLDRGCISQIQSACPNGNPIAGGFRQRIEDPRRIFRFLEAGNAARIRFCGMPYGDQGLFIHRDLLHDVGGVPTCPLMEDVELMRKVRRRIWPILLPGPIHVSARRWQQRGVVSQTVRNQLLLLSFRFGVSPKTLARWYGAHIP